MNIIVFEHSEWGLALPLDDERSIHIREILRAEPGQPLRVGLLDSGVGTAQYRGIQGKSMVLDFPDRETLVAGRSALPVTVILGQPRPPVMQRLLKDLSALGIESLLVVASELSEKSYMQSKLWQTVPGHTPLYRRFLVQGAQQGGHAFLTNVERHYGMRSALDSLASHNTSGERLVLDIDASAQSFLAYAAATKPSPKILAIGPERGWSEAERELLKNTDFQTFHLGSSILRTETACTLCCGMLAMALEKSPGRA